MNSVVPSCRLNSFSAWVSDSGSMSDRRALCVCTAGRGGRWELQDGQLGQLLLPVAELLIERLPSKPPPLPQRVIGVLDG